MTQAVRAYRAITADREFQYLEILRARTAHDEAQALNNARRKEREKWQVEKNQLHAENDRLRQELAELRAGKSVY